MSLAAAARRYAVDGCLCVAAFCAAALLRYDLVPSDVSWSVMAVLAASALLGLLAFGTLAGLYLGRWRRGTWDELRAIGATSTCTGLVVVAVNRWLLGHERVSSSVGVIGALVFAGGLTLQRLVGHRVSRRRVPPEVSIPRAIVLGAGEAGAQLLDALGRERDPAIVPVGILDDDAGKRRLRLEGVRVLGTTGDIARVAHAVGATHAVIAMPSAPPTVTARLAAEARRAGLNVVVVPSISSAVGVLGSRDLVPIDEVRLLGRAEITLDADANYVSGRRVLVTGAGGSIGSELCKQLARLSPSRLVMLDRDESALHGVLLSIFGEARLDSPDVALCDIRDQEGLRQVFREVRPDVVFHAAALKHVSMLERHPREAFLTNVFGTLHVLRAAVECGVSSVVNISTDKAADPINVLGMSKRMAEGLTTHFSLGSGLPYVSVRFGNVIGSRGSVLTTFREQLRNGGPLTVTDPEATRYFMTASEAVQLTIHAATIGKSGEVLVLDMGEPVNIATVARRLAASSDAHIEVVFTGLRPGEKLHEDLIASEEEAVRPFHPLISHVAGRSLDPEHLGDLPSDAATAMARMRTLTSPGAEEVRN
jgi:FlaA1/EpsC-like NDP-sugar epimerase